MLKPCKVKIEGLQNEKQKIESEKLEQDEVVKRLEEPETAAKEKFKQAWIGWPSFVPMQFIAGMIKFNY